MRRRLTEYALFFREFLRNFHSTGAILPSGRYLAAALTRYVDCHPENGEGAGEKAGEILRYAQDDRIRDGDDGHYTQDSDSPPSRRILEVGPGTGAVTRQIVAAMSPTDRLDLVELNDAFVEQLKRRFKQEPAFQMVSDRARVLHCPVEDLPRSERYDLIVSGLPLNNFALADVERILAVLTELLDRGGTLSFFEYIAVRRARALVSGRSERARLRGIGRALHGVLEGREIRRDAVLLNVPPAWVHHLRK